LPRFLVDEDLPRSTARALEAAGYEALDVRDVGLRGKTDQQVFEYAQSLGAVLVSADKGFGNLLAFPPDTHHGIVLVRVPNELPTANLNAILIRSLDALQGEDLRGVLVVVESGRTRLRRQVEPDLD
jgi:predicted nuclease of predicted toxin-antitoxin system